MVLYMQQQQHGRDGVDAQDGLSAFIHSTVTVRSLITGRIDKLRPSEQLTLKVAPFWLLSCRYRYMQCRCQCPQKCWVSSMQGLRSGISASSLAGHECESWLSPKPQDRLVDGEKEREV